MHINGSPWVDFINCFAPCIQHFEKLFTGANVGRRAQKIGAGRKLVYEMDPMSMTRKNFCRLSMITRQVREMKNMEEEIRQMKRKLENFDRYASAGSLNTVSASNNSKLNQPGSVQNMMTPMS